MADFEEVLKYRVDLDTQGLQAQLASVRDVVGRGIQGAVGGVGGGLQIAGGATNQVVNDLSMATGTMMGAMGTVRSAFLPVGTAGATFMPNQPGMPQTFTQEVIQSGILGNVVTPRVGVMGRQAEFVARERLRDRLQTGFASAQGFLAGDIGGGLLGTGLGFMLGGPAGAFVGGIAGSLLGSTLMEPVMSSIENRQQSRAQIMDTFGFNFMSHQQRMDLSDRLAFQSAQSIFSADEFQRILPGAAQAGFFRGIGRGPNAASQIGVRMQEAEQFVARNMFALGVTGEAGMNQAFELTGQLRRMGMNISTAEGRARAERQFQMSNVVARSLRRATGEVISSSDLMRASMFVGSQARTLGLSPARASEAFLQENLAINEAIERGALGTEDLALIGESPIEAAQNMTMTLAGTQRHPLMRALTFAAARQGPGGEVSIDPTMVSQMTGTGAFEAAQARLMDMTSGREGVNRMFALMANQNQLRSQMLQNHGEMLMGTVDEMLRQGGIEMNANNRMLIMQNVFGIDEAQSRALVKTSGLRQSAQERAEEDRGKLDRDISKAITDKQESTIQSISSGLAGIRESFASVMDEQTNFFASKIVPPLEGTNDRLDRLIRATEGGTMTSRSPISVGPINFTGESHFGPPPDPTNNQIFNSVKTSMDMMPKPVLSRQEEPVIMPISRRQVFGGSESAGA